MACYAKCSGGVNFRRGPGTNTDILGMIYGDETLTVLDSSSNSDWVKVYRPKTGQVGWVSRSLIDYMYCDRG